MKLLALGNCFGAGAIYEHMFDEFITLRTTDSLDIIEKGDVVMYGGGEDISPSLYGEKLSHMTHAPADPSRRDQWEHDAFKRAQEVGAYSYGICRGAQLVCALSGGKLVQHVNNHAGRGHWVVTNQKEEYVTSSVHHQMMWPYRLPKAKFQVLAKAKDNLSDVYVFNDTHVLKRAHEEPEIVWFPETKSLGIQGHPEFMDTSAPFVKYSKALVSEYLIKE